MTTVEQVLASVATLPLAERHRLVRELQQSIEKKPQTVASQTEQWRGDLEEYQRAKQWLAAHQAEFVGQWVALDGDHLISHGPDALEVDAQARAAGIEKPFVVRIAEPEPKFFYAGW